MVDLEDLLDDAECKDVKAQIELAELHEKNGDLKEALKLYKTICLKLERRMTPPCSAYGDCKWQDGTVIVPEGFYAIKSSAFFRNKNVKKIQFASTIDTILSLAFYDSGLTEIIIPDTIKDLETDAFNMCQDATKLQISKSLTHIRRGCFANLNVPEIIIPDSVCDISWRGKF